MDQRTFRFFFRTAVAVGVLLVLFYLGRPVFWGISARLQEAREKRVDVSATELASHGECLFMLAGYILAYCKTVCFCADT
jgi:hypothetical protein